MLLLIVFVAVVFIYTLFSFLRERSLFPLATILGMIRHLFTAHKFFVMTIGAGVGLHLWAHITLGPVAYNTSGFDMLSHALFGFLVIGTMDKVDLFAGRDKRAILLFSLAITFHLVHEWQEEVQKLIPGLASQVSTEFTNQLRDLGFNLIGILGYFIIGYRGSRFK